MRHFKVPHSRSFAAATSQYLEASSAVLSAIPMTVCAWFNTNSITANQTIFYIGDKDVDVSRHQLQVRGGDAGDPVSCSTQDTPGTFAQSTINGVTANTWNHAAGVWAATNSRTAYLNGTAGTTETTNLTTFNAFDRTSIGRLGRSSATDYFSGNIVWPAVWNIALSDPELQRLARGANPLTVRPEALVAFWEWTGANTEFGLRGAFPLVNSSLASGSSLPSFAVPFLSKEIITPRRRLNSVASGNRRRRVICGAPS